MWDLFASFDSFSGQQARLAAAVLGGPVRGALLCGDRAHGHLHRRRHDHRPDQAPRPRLRDRHPEDHTNGEEPREQLTRNLTSMGQPKILISSHLEHTDRHTDKRTH